MNKTDDDAPGCDEPFAFGLLTLHCSLDVKHDGPHRAELDHPGGEVFLQWPHGWGVWKVMLEKAKA
jgi:hypothetical protein